MLTFLPEQKGQFVPLVLLPTVDFHWWPFLIHFHQTFLLEVLETSSGLRLLFFVGCHSFAIFGNKNFKLFSLLTFWPEQKGQFIPLVLLEMTDFHSWPPIHFHQTFLGVPLVTSSGLRLLFLVGCHSFAISGNKNLRLFSLLTFLPEQKGQFVPLVLFTITASHSWPFIHFHQIFLPEPKEKSLGVKSVFFLKSNSFTRLG